MNSSHLLKVRERLVDVVLVVEAQPSHVDGVGVHGVRPQQVVGNLTIVGISFKLAHFLINMILISKL